MRQAILCFALLLAIAIPQNLSAAPRLNKWEAMNIGLTALKAKYPNEYQDLVLKHRPYTAEFKDGIWHVSGKKRQFILGRGIPMIEVRDRDQKILKIYFQRKVSG